MDRGGDANLMTSRGAARLHRIFLLINRPLRPDEPLFVLPQDMALTEEGFPVPATDPRAAFSIGMAGTAIPLNVAQMLHITPPVAESEGVLIDPLRPVRKRPPRSSSRGK